jgi:hypothetical protein
VAVVKNFEVMFGTDTEPRFVEFCNFLQCHTFVNYLSIINLKQLFSLGVKPQFNFRAYFLIKSVLNIVIPT